VHKLCNGEYDCISGEDEAFCNESLSCPGFFKCTDGNCIDFKHVCDGQVHCFGSSDDEALCNLPVCPKCCNCKGSYFDCSNQTLNTLTFSGSDIRKLDLSSNKLELKPTSFNHFYFLLELDLSNNKISLLGDIVSPYANLYNLRYLNMSYNMITSLKQEMFLNMFNLKYLDLSHNMIEHISSQWFEINEALGRHTPRKLEYLNLAQNIISHNGEYHFSSYPCNWFALYPGQQYARSSLC